MRSSLMGSASRFAHLAGIALGGSRSATRAEEDSRDDEARGGRRSRAADDDEEGEPKGKRSRADDNDDDKDEPKGRRSRASDDDDEDEPKGKRSRASDDDDEDEPKGKRSRASEDDDEDEPKGKRSRASDDDDDDDKNEMSGRSAMASARRRERSRCAAIFAASAAAENPALAASLAFETTMTRKEAVAVLKSQAGRGAAPGSRDVRGDRRDRNPQLGPGGESSPTGAQATAALWDRTLAKIGVTGPAK